MSRDRTLLHTPLSLSCCSQISFGRDFEQQLGFFVEARASFSNVDSILVYLIQVGLQPLPLYPPQSVEVIQVKPALF